MLRSSKCYSCSAQGRFCSIHSSLLLGRGCALQCADSPSVSMSVLSPVSYLPPRKPMWHEMAVSRFSSLRARFILFSTPDREGLPDAKPRAMALPIEHVCYAIIFTRIQRLQVSVANKSKYFLHSSFYFPPKSEIFAHGSTLEIALSEATTHQYKSTL